MKHLKILFLILINLSLCSFNCDRLSARIKKSQIKEYGKSYPIIYLHAARSYVFENLKICDKINGETNNIYLIEVYGITNSNWSLFLIIGANNYYYNGKYIGLKSLRNIGNYIEKSDKPNIPREIVNAFINQEYRFLKNVHSGFAFIGTKISFKEKLLIEHFKW